MNDTKIKKSLIGVKGPAASFSHQGHFLDYQTFYCAPNCIPPCCLYLPRCSFSTITMPTSYPTLPPFS